MKRLACLITYLAISLALVGVVFPYFWIFLASFKPFEFLVRPTIAFKPTLENWLAVINRPGFGRSILNSFVVALGVSLASLLLGSPAAYAFSRFKTGGSLGRLSVLALQMLPPAVLGIPLFLMFVRIGLKGSLLAAMAAHLTFVLPIVAWFLIGFFDEIPRELEEQAKIDGCTDFQAFVRVVLPLVAPGLAAAAIFAFILSWNEFFYSLLLTGGPSKTVPVVLGEFWTFRGIELGQMSAAVVITILPVLVLSFLIQKHMVRGLSRGAIKG